MVEQTEILKNEALEDVGLLDHPVCAAKDATRHFINAQPPLIVFKR